MEVVWVMIWGGVPNLKLQEDDKVAIFVCPQEAIILCRWLEYCRILHDKLWKVSVFLSLGTALVALILDIHLVITSPYLVRS